MRTADEIRNIQFQRAAMGGYKQADVDIFLEELADTVEAMSKEKQEIDSKVLGLTRKIEEYQSSEGSIHTALLSAQRLADQTVKEAGEAAGHMTSEATKKSQLMVSEAEQEAAAIMKAVEEKITKMMNDAIAKSESMIAAAHDSVARQQLLFDKMRIDVVAFRSAILPKYEEMISILDKMPNEVPFGPERIAEAVNFEYNKKPEPKAFLNNQQEKKAEAKPAVANTKPSDEAAESAKTNAKPDENKPKDNTQQENRQPVAAAPPTAQVKNSAQDAVNAPKADSKDTAQPVGQQKQSGFKIIVDEDDDDEPLVMDLNKESESDSGRGMFKKRK